MGTVNNAAASITPAMVLAAVLSVASAIVLLSNAAEKIIKAWKAAKAPNDRQDKRMDEFEAWKNGELKKWQEDVERKLNRDKEQLDSIHDGLCASFQAQLALLEHGIVGNNIKQMQDAKETLQKYLIDHK